MSMTDQEQKDLRKYCAFLLKEYGFHFSPNDPVIPALYIIHKEMQVNNKNNIALASQVKKAASQMSPRVFNFNVAGEAWKFQMGSIFKWVVIGLIVLLFAALGGWYWSMANDVNKARSIIHSSENVSELMKLAKQNNEGYSFIDFTIAKGDSIQHFKEYQKLNAKTVRVYLGKESK
jgi:hypothetical protein